MEDRGKLIGYTGDECTQCKRMRVEAWENSEKICKKCGWNQEKECYENDYDL